MRKVLEKVTAADISNEAFLHDLEMDRHWHGEGLAMRISLCGRVGLELHIPFDQALHVWDKLKPVASSTIRQGRAVLIHCV